MSEYPSDACLSPARCIDLHPLMLGHGLRDHKSTKATRAGCYFSSDSVE